MNTGQSAWMIPTRSSPGTSAAVNTASTPGAARGRGRVDLEHVGPGVVGEPERSVQHAGNPDVVDVVAVAERELDALVPGAAGPDAAQRDTASGVSPLASTSTASRILP